MSNTNRLKRASYRDAIDWVANMDSAGDSDSLSTEAVAELITVVLVSDLFGTTPEKVAKDVVNHRIKHNIGGPL